MQSVYEDKVINCNKLTKSANLLLSASTEIHVNYLHPVSSQNPVDTNQKLLNK